MKKKKKGLLILHIDGLSFAHVQKALQENHMPFTKRLIDREGYEVLRYRCGLPSTTPFVQAGIIYGDNREIPSFYWWDKQAGVYIKFGAGSTFRMVAHKYFVGTKPLTLNGACIATCFPGRAKQTFALAYRRDIADGSSQTMKMKLFFHWVRNPFHMVDWLYYSCLILLKIVLETFLAFFVGKKVPMKYIAGNLLNEFFLHHLTRYATSLAMKENYPVIYAAFYAYDEVSHAFGPDDAFTYRMLYQVDRTIKYLADKRTADGYFLNKLLKLFRFRPIYQYLRDYELLVLSDHGQIPTVAFKTINGKQIHEVIGKFLPTYSVTDRTGATHKQKDHLDGHVMITYSGGLAHVYFTDISWRLTYGEIQRRFPKLLVNIVKEKGIGGIIVRDKKQTLILSGKKKIQLSNPLNTAAKKFLQQFDEPNIIARQIKFLNSFERAGDFLIFGESMNTFQVNFESQEGGHGSFGGDQLFPFILAKKDWRIPAKSIENAVHLHKVLKKLRDRLV